MALKTKVGSEEKLMSCCWKPFTLRGQIKKKKNNHIDKRKRLTVR